MTADNEELSESGQRMQKRIKLHLSENTPGCVGGEVNVRAAMLTIFLLAIPKRYFGPLSAEVQQQVALNKALEALPQPLGEEVSRTEQQMETLSDMSSAHCADCDCFDLVDTSATTAGTAANVS